MPVNFGDSGAHEPLPVALPEAARARLPHQSRAPFLLAAHPLRWQYSPLLGRWLPALKVMAYEPGVGGVDKDGDDTLARVSAEKRGWRVIPHNCVPAGTPGGQYIRAYQARSGLLHVTAWETPRTVGGREVASQVDERGYHEWLAWLVDQGHVAPPTPEGVLPQIEAQTSTVQQLVGLARTNPAAAEELAEAKALLEAMRRALDPKPAPAAKAPKNLTPTASE